MKKLSYWASINPWKARIIIIFSHIIILLLGWYIGSSLNQINIFLPGALLFSFIIYYLASAFLYPSKNERRQLGGHRYYIKQKVCDFSLIAAAFGMIICIANNKNVQTGFFNSAIASSAETSITKKEKPTAAEILESLKHRDKNTLTRTEKRILKNEFFVQLKKYGVAKLKGDSRAGDEAGLIILSIVLALGLLYLVAALACNLSCNGNDGAAVIVGLLGTAAIIIGLLLVLKGIKKRQQREIDAKVEEESKG